MRRVLLASKLTIDKYYPPAMVPGTKYHPVCEKPGGAGVTISFVLHSLGLRVRLMGQYTRDDEPFRTLAVHEGIEWAMRFVEGRTAVNVVLPEGPTILRVVPGSEYIVDNEVGRTLTEATAAAIALGGSLDHEFVKFMLEAGAVNGVPCFWNPGSSADLRAIDCGAEVYLQVSFADYSIGTSSPADLAQELIGATAAAGVVVTDAERGAYGIHRGSAELLFAPPIELGGSMQEVGAGDAHFGGFIAMFLNAPKCVRFERSLGFARIVAARHVSGLQPTDWRGLREFVNSHFPLGVVRKAA